MRKTVTLDDDVNQMLREEMRATGKTLSAVFNDAMWRGFKYEELMRRNRLPSTVGPSSEESSSITLDKQNK